MWRIDREFDNFRSAATWALERGRPDATVRLAAVIAEAFVARGEGRSALSGSSFPRELHGRDFVFVRTMLAYILLSTGDVKVRTAERAKPSPRSASTVR